VTHYVYAIQKIGYGVKVGRTTNPTQRLATLKAKYGRDLTMPYLKIVDLYPHRVEGRAHAALKYKRINGEWEWFDVSVIDAMHAINIAYVDTIIEDTGKNGKIVTYPVFKKIDRFTEDEYSAMIDRCHLEWEKRWKKYGRRS
jgi:hypothetical protein